MLFKKSIEDIEMSRVRTEEEETFLYWYYKKMPVGINKCVMNRICWKIENEFKKFKTEIKVDSSFDYSILKSGVKYASSDYKKIKEKYEEFTRELQTYQMKAKRYRLDSDDVSLQRALLKQEFQTECQQICPNAAELCDIIVDLCYSTNKSKQFAWEMCGDTIIENLLNKNERKIVYPSRSDNGNIVYCAERFELMEAEI